MSFISELRSEMKRTREDTLLQSLNSEFAKGAHRFVERLVDELSRDDSYSDSQWLQSVLDAIKGRAATDDTPAVLGVAPDLDWDAIQASIAAGIIQRARLPDRDETTNCALTELWKPLGRMVCQSPPNEPHEVLRLSDAAHQTHFVFFPTARIERNAAIGADVFRVSVSVFSESAANNWTEYSDLWDQLLKNRIDLAPWSLFRLDEQTLDSLNHDLDTGDLKRQLGLSNTGFRVLLEIEHVVGFQGEIKSGPPNVVVSGESLTVATILALWAAQHGRELHRLAVTGAVNGTQITAVDHVAAKWEAVKRVEPPVRCFMVPAENADAVDAGVSVQLLPSTIGDLLQQHTLLTDGLDQLRLQLAEVAATRVQIEADPRESQEFLTTEELEVPSPEYGAFSTDEVELFASIVNSGINDADSNSGVFTWCDLDSPWRLIDEDKTQAVLSIPFGNSPRRVAQKLSVGLAKRWNTFSESATEKWTVLPVDLGAIDNDFVNGFTKAAISAVEELPVAELSGDQSILSADVIRNRVVSGRWDHLCIVAYGPPSLDVNYDAMQKFLSEWKVRLDAIDNGSERPLILFVASDEHHARFLTSTMIGAETV